MTKGLHQKYVVVKTETGKPIENQSFTLIPDKDPVALEALKYYAEKTENLHLKGDLLNWIDELERPKKLLFVELFLGGDGEGSPLCVNTTKLQFEDKAIQVTTKQISSVDTYTSETFKSIIENFYHVYIVKNGYGTQLFERLVEVINQSTDAHEDSVTLLTDKEFAAKLEELKENHFNYKKAQGE